MRITERCLRKIIKQVLIEINTPQQAQAAMVRSDASKNEDDFEKASEDFYPENRKGIKLRKRKGIKLSKGRDKLAQNRLISKFRKDLKLEDDIIPERTSQFSKSFDKELKTEEEAMTTYDVKLLQDKKDESKTNSFMGPLMGKSNFLIRYEGNVFAVKIKYRHPEDNSQHKNDLVKKLKNMDFSNKTKNASYF